MGFKACIHLGIYIEGLFLDICNFIFFYFIGKYKCLYSCINIFTVLISIWYSKIYIFNLILTVDYVKQF